MYDPVLEQKQKDYCQGKRCREVSDIIVKGKGYCDYHYDELFSLHKNPMPHDLVDCGCSDCMPEGSVPQEVVVTQPQYASIEEYKRATGKRYRMTKEQKLRGLTRDQAVTEFVT